MATLLPLMNGKPRATFPAHAFRAEIHCQAQVFHQRAWK